MPAESKEEMETESENGSEEGIDEEGDEHLLEIRAAISFAQAVGPKKA